MKKRLFQDKPRTDERGQYTFFNDSDINYSDSNGIPPRFDKFMNRDLYSSVKEDPINKIAVDFQVPYNGTSYIKINKLDL